MIDSDIKLFAADMDGTLLDGANSFNQKKIRSSDQYPASAK